MANLWIGAVCFDHALAKYQQQQIHIKRKASAKGIIP